MAPQDYLDCVSTDSCFLMPESISSQLSSCGCDPSYSWNPLPRKSVVTSAHSENMGHKGEYLSPALQELFQLHKLISDDACHAQGPLDLVEIEELECSYVPSFPSPSKHPAELKPRECFLGPASGIMNNLEGFKLSQRQEVTADIAVAAEEGWMRSSHAQSPHLSASVNSLPHARQNLPNDSKLTTSSSLRMLGRVAAERSVSGNESTLSCAFGGIPASSSAVEELNPVAEGLQHHVSSFPSFMSDRSFGSIEGLISASCSTTSSTNEALEDDGAYTGSCQKYSWSPLTNSGLAPLDVPTVSVVTCPSLTTGGAGVPSPVSVSTPGFAHDNWQETPFTDGKREGCAWFPQGKESDRYMSVLDGGEAVVYNPNMARSDAKFCAEKSKSSNRERDDLISWASVKTAQSLGSTQQCAGLSRGIPPSKASAFQLQSSDPQFAHSSGHLPVEMDGATALPLPTAKEMLYRAAALRPIDIPNEVGNKPKRRNVKISKDPQSVAARHRREKISERIRILQRLVPGGTKMDTASMLDEAVQYLKFLKMQVHAMNSMGNRLFPEFAGPLFSSSTVTFDLNQPAPLRAGCHSRFNESTGAFRSGPYLFPAR